MQLVWDFLVAIVFQVNAVLAQFLARVPADYSSV